MLGWQQLGIPHGFSKFTRWKRNLNRLLGRIHYPAVIKEMNPKINNKIWKKIYFTNFFPKISILDLIWQFIPGIVSLFQVWRTLLCLSIRMYHNLQTEKYKNFVVQMWVQPRKNKAHDSEEKERLNRFLIKIRTKQI